MKKNEEVTTKNYEPQKYKTWTEIKEAITKSGCDWIQESDGLPEDAVIWAEDFAHYLVYETDNLKPLTTSQLRRFFGEIKTLKAKGFDKHRGQFRMLKAQIAYAVGRDKNKGGNNKTKIISYYQTFSILINDKCVANKYHFKNFVNLNEAVVAYHKEKGGKES